MTEEKIRVFVNTNAKMSRGKAAAHAVHAALTAAGVHPGLPVVVLGAKPKDILALHTHIRDAGHTELEPGTVTAGTDWQPALHLPTVEELARTIHEALPGSHSWQNATDDEAETARTQATAALTLLTANTPEGSDAEPNR